jgi:hypothetical protein
MCPSGRCRRCGGIRPSLPAASPASMSNLCHSCERSIRNRRETRHFESSPAILHSTGTRSRRPRICTRRCCLSAVTQASPPSLRGRPWRDIARYWCSWEPFTCCTGPEQSRCMKENIRTLLSSFLSSVRSVRIRRIFQTTHSALHGLGQTAAVYAAPSVIIGRHCFPGGYVPLAGASRQVLVLSPARVAVSRSHNSNMRHRTSSSENIEMEVPIRDRDVTES